MALVQLSLEGGGGGSGAADRDTASTHVVGDITITATATITMNRAIDDDNSDNNFIVGSFSFNQFQYANGGKMSKATQ
jgi:hypothetical protein